MPAYDFRCPACTHVFEVVRPAGRAAEAVSCPECDTEAKRVFSPVGVVFKGSGFHNTDYRAKPADPAKESPSPSESAPAAPACGGKDACGSCPASTGSS